MARKKGSQTASAEKPDLPNEPRSTDRPQPGPDAARGHDIVVIGGSAGGVQALKGPVSRLPGDLPASVFVVLHVSPEAPSNLPGILSAAGPLPASHAKDGESIEPGRIFVGPPDMHLLLERARARVVHGPKENRHRPAIDPLFRTAARVYGSRVVGVVLSGLLDDGSAGLEAIHSRGGTTVVQDPSEASFAEMPRSALERLPVDHCLKLPAIADLVTRLSREPVRGSAVVPLSDRVEKEARVAFLDPSVLEGEKKPGQPSPYTCPERHGVLWEIDDDETLRFRCRVGHAYSSESLIHAQEDSVERALWTALRVLEERISFMKRLGEDAGNRGLSALAGHFEEKQAEAERNAAFVREALLRNPKE